MVLPPSLKGNWRTAERTPKIYARFCRERPASRPQRLIDEQFKRQVRERNRSAPKRGDARIDCVDAYPAGSGTLDRHFPCNRPSQQTRSYKRQPQKLAVHPMRLIVFGLTLSSSWGNGHATLWRGLGRALAKRGHEILFFERNVPYYAQNRDLTRWAHGELVLFG